MPTAGPLEGVIREVCFRATKPAVFGSGPTNRMSAAPPSRLTPYDPDVAGKMDKAAEIIRRYRKTLHLLVK